jgi:hypothetical protein
MLLHAIKTFTNDEDGAVTVDWVVLTAALVGLGLAVMVVVKDGISDLAGDIDTELKKDHTTFSIDLSGSGSGG